MNIKLRMLQLLQLKINNSSLVFDTDSKAYLLMDCKKLIAHSKMSEDELLEMLDE